MKYFFAILFTFSSLFSYSQLPDGSLAPNFTATDVNGNEHQLYDYLDMGYTVIIQISASWSPPDWNYHSGGTLEAIWAAHGPAGEPGVNVNTTDDVIVLWFEGDPNTPESELENSDYGNWLAPNGVALNYPIINDDNIAELYNITYYPSIFTICPNRILTLSGQVSAFTHYSSLNCNSNTITSCSELFISEYVEGSSNNKAIEIYNPTSGIINLSEYKIVSYSNGSSSIISEMNLTGFINPYSTWVVTNSDTNSTNEFGYIDIELYNMANQLAPLYPSPLYMNGNDAIGLFKNGVLIDLIGKIGEDPGDAWTDDVTAGFTDANGGAWWTKNHTLVRKGSVKKGVGSNPVLFDPSAEWDSLPNNTWTELGSHDCECQPSPICDNYTGLYCEDFESYQDGDLISVVSNEISTWSGNSIEDVPVTSNYGNNSLFFESTYSFGGPQDIIIPFGEVFDEGDFEFSSRFFINGGAYFNFQAETTVGNTWAVNCYMNNDGTIVFSNDGGGTVFLSSTYPLLEWFKLDVKIDLTLNDWEVFINDSSIGSFSNNINQIASLNFYPLSGHSFWVDDITASHTPFSPIGLDAYLVNISAAEFLTVGESTPFEYTVLNYGAEPITSLLVSWSYGNNVYNDLISDIYIETLESFSFTHEFTFLASDYVTTNLSATIVSVNNGTEESNTTNNTINFSINGVEFVTQKTPLIEHFTSNNSGPDAAYNPTFQTLLNDNNVNELTNNGVNAIKYQVNWPGNPDQSFNQDVQDRVNFYGVNGVPQSYLNAVSYNITQYDIDSESESFSYIDINANAYHSNNTDLTVNVNINAYEDYQNTTVHIAVVEKSYYNDTGTNGEVQFYQVMRKMLPNANGTPIELDGGSSYSIGESSSFEIGNVTSGSFNLWQGLENCNVIVFVQDTLSKEILQSKVIGISNLDNLSNCFYCEDFESVNTPSLPSDMSTSSLENGYYVPFNGNTTQVQGFYTGNSEDAGVNGYWTYLQEHTTFAMTNDDACSPSGSTSSVNNNCDLSFEVLELPSLDFTQAEYGMWLQFEYFHDKNWGGGDAYVEISTDGGFSWTDISGPLDDAQLWQSAAFDLSNYYNETNVTIRFVWSDNGSWASGFAVDDIVVNPLSQYAMNLNDYKQFFTSTYLDETSYPIIPLNQANGAVYNFKGTVKNTGANNLDSARLHVSIPSLGFSTLSYANNTPSLETNTFYCNSTYNATSTGTYDVVMYAADDNGTQTDIKSIQFTVSDYDYARDNASSDEYTGGAYINDQGSEQRGNVFDIYADAMLYAIKVRVHPQTSPSSMAKGVLNIRNEDGDWIYLAETDEINVGSMTDDWVNFVFDEPIQLLAGQVVLPTIRADYTGSNTLIIATNGNSNPGEALLQDIDGILGGSGQWYFTTNTPMVRLNFDPSIINTIQYAREQELGSEVTVSGVVTASNEFGPNFAMIEDNTAGITIYDIEFGNNVDRGDSITVTGVLTDYLGFLQLQSVSNFTNHGSGYNIIPQIITPNELGEDTESELVTIENVVFENPGEIISGASLLQFSYENQNGAVYVRNGTELVGSQIPQEPTTITGISTQYTLTGEGGYQIWIRDLNDIITYKTYVPNNNFEQYLIDAGYDDVLDDSVLTSNIIDIEYLYLNDSEINDFTGIQSMPNLSYFFCDNNNLYEIDISQNTNLISFSCNNNNLTELDVSQNINLNYLECYNNNITEIEFSSIVNNLGLLNCENNAISELDLSNCINLGSLYFSQNNISEIDVSQILGLVNLGCWGNNLSAIDVSQNLNLSWFAAGINNISSIDLTNNLSLNTLYLDENNLSSLDVTQNTQLSYLEVGQNNLSSIDLSQNTNLNYLSVYFNNLTTLDVSQNSMLTSLYCKFNNLEELDLTNCSFLNYLSCRFNNLNELDISQNVNLNELWLNGGNPNLFCVTTHDTVWANSQANFYLSDDKFFSVNCEQENIIVSCFDETAPNYDNTDYDETIYTLVNQGCFNGLTYIPDDAFEQYLIELGFDNVMDNYMSTYTAQNITQLFISNLDIFDLTGIEDFEILNYVVLQNLPIDSINLSSNSNLEYLTIQNSNIDYLNIQNGNNTNLVLSSQNNTELNCILVDDVEYASINWTVENDNIDSWTSFSELSFEYILTINEASDPENCDGLVIVDVTESLSSYNYSWNGSPSSSFSYLCGGNNTFEISDPNGQCSQTVTIFVGPYLMGCMDEEACNYNSLANQQDNSCIYPITYYDCDFNCISDSDFDGICDELEVFGCTSNSSPNYDPLATEDDGSCIECYLELDYIIDYPTNSTSCDGIIGVIVNNSEYDFSIYVNDVELSSNYNFNSCYGNNSIYVIDEQGCSVSEVLFLTAESIDGCTDPTALNFNSEATSDDGSCIYSNQDACDFTPTGLFVDNIIHNRISFNWSAPSLSPSHYMIRYRPVGTTQWTVITAGPQTPAAFNGTSRTRFFMEPSTTYEWSMRARLLNSDGTTNCQSPWSANSQYTTLPACANLENLSVSTEANWVTFFADAPDASWGVWQSKGKMREIGTNAYRYVNGNSNGDINGLKGNFTASTDYEWHTKAWCTGNLNQNGAPDPMYHSGWGDFSPFSTEDPCDKMPTNLTTSSNGANTAVIMSWDTPESGAPDHYFLELTNTTTGQQFQWNNIPGTATSKAKYNQNIGDVFAWKIRGACGTNGTSWATSFSDTEYYILGGARLEDKELTKVELSPNPSRGIFNVSFEVPRNNTIDITISNYLGKEVYSEQFNHQEDMFKKSIDISSNADGIYLLTIKTNTGLINKRVVIQ